MDDKETLIRYLISNGYLKTKEIIEAFRKVRREDFLPEELKQYAYNDTPLPIMKGQTISQPSTIAIMMELLSPKRGDKILEIGTGSGYQAALLSEVVGEYGKIVTMERIPELYEYAKKKLKNYKNVIVILGDGSLGYEKYAPYDGIIVTAAVPQIPPPLKEQVKNGGRIVAPVGNLDLQEMVLLEKRGNKWIEKRFGYFGFVPLIGRYGFKEI